MKTKELKSKIITQLRFHRVSGKHEDLTADHLVEIFEEYRSQPTESKELPGDEEMKDWAEIHAIHCYHDGLTSKKHFVEGYLYAVDFFKNNYASPLLASKDARIRELEEANKLAEIKIAELIELNLTPTKN
jgi:hypothetical protein